MGGVHHHRDVVRMMGMSDGRWTAARRCRIRGRRRWVPRRRHDNRADDDSGSDALAPRSMMGRGRDGELRMGEGMMGIRRRSSSRRKRR